MSVVITGVMPVLSAMVFFPMRWCVCKLTSNVRIQRKALLAPYVLLTLLFITQTINESRPSSRFERYVASPKPHGVCDIDESGGIGLTGGWWTFTFRLLPQDVKPIVDAGLVSGVPYSNWVDHLAFDPMLKGFQVPSTNGALYFHGQISPMPDYGLRVFMVNTQEMRALYLWRW